VLGERQSGVEDLDKSWIEAQQDLTEDSMKVQGQQPASEISSRLSVGMGCWILTDGVVSWDEGLMLGSSPEPAREDVSVGPMWIRMGMPMARTGRGTKAGATCVVAAGVEDA